MNKKIILIFILTTTFFISGCGKSEAEAFAGVEDVANESQINIHFDWMDKQLNDDDYCMFWLYLTDMKTNEEALIDCVSTPMDGKLGIKVYTSGNQWYLGNLYYEPAQLPYGFLHTGSSEEIDPELEGNANWELTPLLDNYHLWLDDYVDFPNMHENITPIQLFYLTDTNSDTQYVVTLNQISDDRVMK